MKKILLAINMIFYCLITMLLIIALTKLVIPILLIAVAIQLLIFMCKSIAAADFPEKIKWREIPDALTQLTCELGHAFGFDLMSELKKLAQK